MHCAGRPYAVRPGEGGPAHEKALKDTPREAISCIAHGDDGVVRCSPATRPSPARSCSPDGDARLQGPPQPSRCTSGRSPFRRSNSAVRGGQAEMDTHTLLVGVVAGPGGGFDINAADCDHWVFSSKVIHRQAALWLPSSSEFPR